ncbi:thiamin phosphate synthase [Klebsiella michiganensis]|uniref:Thiamin phosphate synthase n=1 Tax=Klebsiella michiganensis TaxID=1134687 RepID=A0A7H4PDG6_9ENTR|nr:thiamin phosphate synthase [Klebsiella michiganensis]
MEQHFLHAVPENAPYEHDYEGPDDMPSHIKSSMLGVSLMLPVRDGSVRLGTWQGIWLGEHRIHGGSRHIIATLMGNKNDNFGFIAVLHGKAGRRTKRT